MGEESLVQVGPTAVSLLALVLSLFNLYLQRRDRRPRPEIRARYEYRTGTSDGTSGEDAPPPLLHDDSQEGLYMLLGDFLREYGLEYPQGSPVVRFALSNKGTRPSTCKASGWSSAQAAARSGTGWCWTRPKTGCSPSNSPRVSPSSSAKGDSPWNSSQATGSATGSS